jgi:glutamate-ammonia-ligase adenylyltransferase
MAIIALGRFGGREMTLESDLDLIFVYDHPKGEQASTGRAALSPGQYFARLSQGMINALTAPTAEGRLYDVDMRLRPSGNSGPIAVGIVGFRRYQTTEAWAWEHLALTRARVVAGPAPLCRRIEKIVANTLTMSRDWQKLRTEVVEMRQRIAQEHPASHPWSVKHVRGGLVDIEFIAQCLQLRHAARLPAILSTHTLEALDRMRRAGVLERKTATDLQAAARLEGDILQLTRLCQSETFEAKSAPSGIKTALARMAKAANFETLESRLQAAETRTLEIYRALIEHDAADDTSRPKNQSAAKAKSKNRATSAGKQQPAPSSPTFKEKSPMRRTLSAGDVAPDFDLPTDSADAVSLKSFRKQTLVLYFYPKDDTTGCTNEAIEFSALARAFAKAGAVVVGCSRDTVASHAKFRKKHKLKILLGSDADGRSTETYGVWVEKSMYGRKYMGIERSTFLIDREGRIAKIWRKVKTAGHAEEVLSEIKKL